MDVTTLDVSPVYNGIKMINQKYMLVARFTVNNKRINKKA
jgi:hypothetical protein